MVRILQWPNVNFSGHKKWISQAPLDQGVNWYLVSASLIFLGAVCWQPTKQGVPQGDPMLMFLNGA